MDWGVETFATLALPDGTAEAIENPRLGKADARAIRVASRAVSRKKKGSHNRRKAVKALRRLRQKQANRRLDFQHKTSAAMVSRFALIATEELSVKNMTASAKGTAEQPTAHGPAAASR